MPKQCELRIRYREDSEEEGQCETKTICGVCDFSLGMGGKAPSEAELLCASCPIPDEITQSKWACLHLRPVRLMRGTEVNTYFACRWYYKWNPKQQPESLYLQCPGCSLWFPRPSVARIPHYWEETAMILAAIATSERRKRLTSRLVEPQLRGRLWGFVHKLTNRL